MSSMLRIGDLRRRVTIQKRQSKTTDAFGQQTQTWVDVLTGVPAAIEPLNGREMEAAQAIGSEVNVRLTVRYHPLLASPVAVAAMRAVYVNGGVTRIFNIEAMRNLDERNAVIELLAAEGLNEG